ncbi:hypothetical protein BLNAU_18588 [Blattamonas nauphoetae]|uniref:Uncharacterized protein n=1 Tax=Blattamonas nauphoetae TaxID=2049346 RepID=A0ABQ9X4F8_9EUKA|nr:hypothetical protein BLNAU_18588 [Blattamonas nauphoetae]
MASLKEFFNKSSHEFSLLPFSDTTKTLLGKYYSRLIRSTFSPKLLDMATPIKQLDRGAQARTEIDIPLASPKSSLRNEKPERLILFDSHFGYDMESLAKAQLVTGTDILPPLDPPLERRPSAVVLDTTKTQLTFLDFPKNKSSNKGRYPEDSISSTFSAYLSLNFAELSTRCQERVKTITSHKYEYEQQPATFSNISTPILTTPSFPALLHASTPQHTPSTISRTKPSQQSRNLSIFDQFLSNVVDEAMQSTLSRSVNLANAATTIKSTHTSNSTLSPDTLFRSSESLLQSSPAHFEAVQTSYLISPAVHNSMLVFMNWKKLMNGALSTFKQLSHLPDSSPPPHTSHLDSDRRNLSMRSYDQFQIPSTPLSLFSEQRGSPPMPTDTFVQLSSPPISSHVPFRLKRQATQNSMHSHIRTMIYQPKTTLSVPPTPHHYTPAIEPITYRPEPMNRKHRLWRQIFSSSIAPTFPEFTPHQSESVYPLPHASPTHVALGFETIPERSQGASSPSSPPRPPTKRQSDVLNVTNFPALTFSAVTHFFISRQSRSLCHSSIVEPYFVSFQTFDLMMAFDSAEHISGLSTSGFEREYRLFLDSRAKSRIEQANELIQRISRSPSNISYADYIKMTVATQFFPELCGILPFITFGDLGWAAKGNFEDFISMFKKATEVTDSETDRTGFTFMDKKDPKHAFALMTQLTKQPIMPSIPVFARLITKNSKKLRSILAISVFSSIPVPIRTHHDIFTRPFPRTLRTTSTFGITCRSFDMIISLLTFLSNDISRIQFRLTSTWQQKGDDAALGDQIISAIAVLRDVLWVLDIVGSILSSSVGSSDLKMIHSIRIFERSVLKLSVLIHLVFSDVLFWSFFRTYLLNDYRVNTQTLPTQPDRPLPANRRNLPGMELYHQSNSVPYFQPNSLPSSQSTSAHFLCNTLFLPVFNFSQNQRLDDFVPVVSLHPPHWTIFVTETVVCSTVLSFFKLICGWEVGKTSEGKEDGRNDGFAWKRRQKAFIGAGLMGYLRLTPYGPWVRGRPQPDEHTNTSFNPSNPLQSPSPTLSSTIPFLPVTSASSLASFVNSHQFISSAHKVNFYGTLQIAQDVRFIIRTCCEHFNLTPRTLLTQANSIRIPTLLFSLLRLLMLLAGFPNPHLWGSYAQERLKLHSAFEKVSEKEGDAKNPMSLPWVRAPFLSGAIGMSRDGEDGENEKERREEKDVCEFSEIDWERNEAQSILIVRSFMTNISGTPTLLPFASPSSTVPPKQNNLPFTWTSFSSPCLVRFDTLPQTHKHHTRRRIGIGRKLSTGTHSSLSSGFSRDNPVTSNLLSTHWSDFQKNQSNQNTAGWQGTPRQLDEMFFPNHSARDILKNDRNPSETGMIVDEKDRRMKATKSMMERGMVSERKGEEERESEDGPRHFQRDLLFSPSTSPRILRSEGREMEERQTQEQPSLLSQDQNQPSKVKPILVNETNTNTLTSDTNPLTTQDNQSSTSPQPSSTTDAKTSSQSVVGNEQIQLLADTPLLCDDPLPNAHSCQPVPILVSSIDIPTIFGSTPTNSPSLSVNCHILDGEDGIGVGSDDEKNEESKENDHDFVRPPFLSNKLGLHVTNRANSMNHRPPHLLPRKRSNRGVSFDTRFTSPDTLLPEHLSQSRTLTHSPQINPRHTANEPITLDGTVNRGLMGIFAPAVTEMMELGRDSGDIIAIPQNLDQKNEFSTEPGDWDEERVESEAELGDDGVGRTPTRSPSSSDTSFSSTGPVQLVSESTPLSPPLLRLHLPLDRSHSSLSPPIASDLSIGRKRETLELKCLMQDEDLELCDSDCAWCASHSFPTKSIHRNQTYKDTPEKERKSSKHSIQPDSSDDSLCGLSEEEFEPVGCLGGQPKKRARTHRMRCRKEKRLIALPFPMDSSPFLNWNEERLESEVEMAIVFLSLIATVKFQPAFDASLETKAVKLLDSVSLRAFTSIDVFLDSLGRTAEESWINFIQCIVVLISSANWVLITATMEMVHSLICTFPATDHFAFVKADLIHRLISSLNPQSLSFAETGDIHINVMKIISKSVWLATPYKLTELRIEDDDEQQAVYETVLQQVITPSENYIRYLCVNRFSIVDSTLSNEIMVLLTQLIRICPSHHPTMNFVLHMPVGLTIPSYLALFEYDWPIYNFLLRMIEFQCEWNRMKGKYRQMWKTVDRVLRMEGIEDVIEEKLRNDECTDSGEYIVTTSIDLSNQRGMNLLKRE